MTLLLSYALLALAASPTGFFAFLETVPAGVWAAAGTVVGTLGLRFLEKWLNRNKEASDVRRNLNEEIKDLVARVDSVEEEVSQWRKRAYDAEEQVALLRIMVLKLGGDLPENIIAKAHRESDKDSE